MKANKRKKIKIKMEYGRKIAGDNEQKKMKRNEKWRVVEEKNQREYSLENEK